MRVKWTRRALTDMEELLDYWEVAAPDTREKKLTAVVAYTYKLEIFPALGRPEPYLAIVRPADALRYATVGFSKIIHQIDGEIIWIKQVLDSRSDPRKLRTEDAL